MAEAEEPKVNTAELKKLVNHGRKLAEQEDKKTEEGRKAGYDATADAYRLYEAVQGLPKERALEVLSGFAAEDEEPFDSRANPMNAAVRLIVGMPKTIPEDADEETKIRLERYNNSRKTIASQRASVIKVAKKFEVSPDAYTGWVSEVGGEKEARKLGREEKTPEEKEAEAKEAAESVRNAMDEASRNITGLDSPLPVPWEFPADSYVLAVLKTNEKGEVIQIVDYYDEDEYDVQAIFARKFKPAKSRGREEGEPKGPSVSSLRAAFNRRLTTAYKVVPNLQKHVRVTHIQGNGEGVTVLVTSNAAGPIAEFSFPAQILNSGDRVAFSSDHEKEAREIIKTFKGEALDLPSGGVKEFKTPNLVNSPFEILLDEEAINGLVFIDQVSREHKNPTVVVTVSETDIKARGSEQEENNAISLNYAGEVPEGAGPTWEFKTGDLSKALKAILEASGEAVGVKVSGNDAIASFVVEKLTVYLPSIEHGVYRDRGLTPKEV